METHTLPPPVAPTPAMWRLRPTLFKIMSWLYATFPIGEAVEVSNARIADAIATSEGAVSPAMPELEQLGFLVREWDPAINAGRGGYVTTLRPPPGSAADPVPADLGSANDPRVFRITTPDPSHHGRRDQQLIGGAVMVDHESYGVGVVDARASSFASTDLRPWFDLKIRSATTIRRLIRSGMTPPQMARLIAMKERERAGDAIGCAIAMVRDMASAGPVAWEAVIRELEEPDALRARRSAAGPAAVPPAAGDVRPAVAPRGRDGAHPPARTGPAERGPIRAPRASGG